MLHGYDGVPVPGQVPQQPDELPGVAGMEAGRRLVEDVGDAGEARAELAGQTETLRLAARERGRRAVEGEVVEPGVADQLEAGEDLGPDRGQDGPRSLRDVRGRGIVAEKADRLAHGQSRELGNRPPKDAHGQGFGPQPAPAAGGAGPLGHQRPHGLAPAVGMLALVLLVHQRGESLPRPAEAVHPFAAAAAI